MLETERDDQQIVIALGRVKQSLVSNTRLCPLLVPFLCCCLSPGGWPSRASTPASSRSGSISKPICACSGVIREALSIASPRPGLMINTNEYWSPKQAVRYVRQLEEHFELIWVEEPARRWDYDGLRLVSQQVRAAVASGENLHNLADFYPLIANHAVDVINVWTGQSGVTGLRQIAHMAHAHGLQVSMMNAQANYMAQIAAALPNHNMMEVVDPGREHCLKYDNRIEDGFIVLGNAPGFGIEVDVERSSGSCRRIRPQDGEKFPFPRREGAGRYIVPPAPGEVPWR